MLEFEHVAVSGRLKPLSLSFARGDFVHVLGANGAGKSTLLAIAAGLLSADKGQVLFKDKTLGQWHSEELAQKRCFVQQQQDSAFALTARESITFFSQWDPIPSDMQAALDVDHLLDRHIGQLSGGEQRRVQLVRCLLPCWVAIEQGSALILLDEPTQGLDLRHQHLLMQWLARLAERGNVVLVSHHDLNLAWQYAQQLLLMKGGEVLFSGAPQHCVSKSLLHQTFDCEVQFFHNAEGQYALQTYLRSE